MNISAQNQPPVHDKPSGPDAGSGGAPPSAIITREGEAALRAELERLRRELENGMVERLREARAFGAAAGNDDYLQIQEEELILSLRVARLEELLGRAQVVDSRSLNGRAAVGTIVEVRNVESDEVSERELVGGHEAPRANAVSAASPVGQALIGHEAGAVVEVQLPRGGSQRLEIVRVRSAEHAFF